jgi:hypothetical protein
MTNPNSIFKKIFAQEAAVTVMFFVLFTLPYSATAATIAATYQPQTTLEFISYLQGVVDTLEAQNNASKSPLNTVASLKVQTAAADVVTKVEAELSATFDSGSRSYVYAWFEYGEGSTLNKKTTRTKVSVKNEEAEYIKTLTGLKSGVTYSYRAVFELPSGTKYYGLVKTFGSLTNVGSNTSGATNVSNSGTTASNSKGSLSTNKTVFKQYVDDIEVDWSIPSNKKGYSNWIGLFKTGASNKKYETWQYLDDSRSGTAIFSSGLEAGTYELRLFFDNSYTDGVTSDRITIEK